MDIYDLLKMADDKSETTDKIEDPFKELYTLSIASELHKSFREMNQKSSKSSFRQKIIAKQR